MSDSVPSSQAKGSWAFMAVLVILVVATFLLAESAVDPWFMSQTKEGAEALVWSGGYKVGDFVQYRYTKVFNPSSELEGMFTFTVAIVNPDNYSMDVVDTGYKSSYRLWNISKDWPQQYGMLFDITGHSEDLDMAFEMRFMGNETLGTAWGDLDCAHFKGMSVYHMDLKRTS